MVEIKNVTISEKGTSKKIINNVSFVVENGKIVALIEENGTGSIALLKAVAGLKKITEGDILIQNKSVKLRLNWCEKSIGYAFEDLKEYDKFTVYEFLDFVANEHKVDVNFTQNYINYYVNMFKLNDVLYVKIKNLSPANCKKVFIIASIIFNPTNWVLFEPFSGLNEADKKAVINLIKSEKQRGVAILIACKDLSMVEKLCNCVALLNGGKLEFFGNIASAKAFNKTIKKI